MFEPVYQVWDDYDGPLSGIAAVRGETCHFSRNWDNDADDWAEHFTLRQLDSEALRLAEEKWAIWRDWEAAFYRGEVLGSTHPGEPGQNARFAELTAALNAMVASSPRVGVSRATFRAGAVTSGVARDLEVEWEEWAS